MFFRTQKAQATVEYVTILLIVLGLFAAFLNQTKLSLNAYQVAMVNKIATR